MNEIEIYSESYQDLHFAGTKDVIIMNPPFEKLGNPFIEKAAFEDLKNNGYLSVVMSQYWRSITIDHSNKTYYKLLRNGSFHKIEMFDDKTALELFGRSIGHIDIFVWQKNANLDKTRIVNQRGMEYHADLKNYPQSPPVLPPDEYDRLFDQVNGIKWYMFTALRDERNEGYGKADQEYFCKFTKKSFMCNKVNVEKCRGRKVIIDKHLKNIVVDEQGNEVVDVKLMFFYNTTKERRKIIKALEFVMENKDLFRNKDDAYIPGIRI